MVKDAPDCPTNYGLTPEGESAAQMALETLAHALSCEVVETIDTVLRTWRTTEPISLLRPIYEQVASVIARESTQASLDLRDDAVRRFVNAYTHRASASVVYA